MTAERVESHRVTPKKKLEADIAKYGWHVLKVFSDTGDAPPFAYTVGLYESFDHPEVIIFGLNNDLDFMHRILNGIGARVKKGESFSHGDQKKKILDGYVCPFANFPASAYDEHLGQAIGFYDAKFPCVQCIWPDPRKKLPWDVRVMPPILERQPVFVRPNAKRQNPLWPFAEPHSRHVLTTIQVVTGKEPVRTAARFEDDGMWQFICDTTNDAEDLVIATLGWVIDRDPSLSKLADLRPGWQATRKGRTFRRRRFGAKS
jgi:hypothetical protein